MPRPPALRYHLPVETIRVSASRRFVRARPIDVEMIFRNLIDNAIKYAGAEPEVEVESHFAGDATRSSRESIDNGRGIPAKLRRKIFGRFVRLGSELERSQTGTGLGLFIVRTLVKRMHGKIAVRDRPQRAGTDFRGRSCPRGWRRPELQGEPPVERSMTNRQG